MRAGHGRALGALALLGALAVGACDTQPLPAVPDATDAGKDTGGSDALAPRDTVGADADRTVSVAVGASACCLAMRDGVAVWAEDGDLWIVRPLTGSKELLVDAEGDQKE